jgi:hypothetical protein
VKDLFHRFDPEQTRREIDEELRLHLDLLTEEHVQQSMSFEEAREAAFTRFGNFEQITDECAQIKRRQHPVVRALKLFLVLIFLSGVVIRIFAPEYHVTHVGSLLMAVGLLGRLWLYLRGLVPSSFISKSEESSPLKLRDDVQSSFAVYDQKKHTPVERVIFCK